MTNPTLTISTYLLVQLAGGDLLHLVNGDGAVHVHGGLVGLMAAEVLYSLGGEALRKEIDQGERRGLTLGLVSTEKILALPLILFEHTIAEFET